MQTLKVSVDADGIALAQIDVSERPMNVLTPELQNELSALIDRVRDDATIKGLVITSGKSNGFIAGADLKDLVLIHGRYTAAEVVTQFDLSQIYRRLETCGKPVAAAINGLALGGGLELCLACHYRVLVDHPKAVVGLPEVKVGLLPGAGGTQRLPRLIGIPAALQLMRDGTPVAPAQALKLGIVHTLAPADALVDQAKAWVRNNPEAKQPWDVKGFRVPGGAGCLAPHAMETFGAGTSRMIRDTQRNQPAPVAIASCVFEGTIVPIDAGLRIEAKYFAKLATGAVARNLIRTSFINKGAAEKGMRRPAGVARRSVSRLGVLGAGLMGGGIAHVAAAAGIDVVLLDATQDRADDGKKYSERLLRKAVAKGGLDEARMQAQLARIQATTDYQALRGCELIVEAVFEQREVKRDVTQKAAAVVGAETIFASNTSTLPISGLAEAWPQPERFVGLHFFSPVERMPLVEIIRGRKTGDEALALAFDFVAQLRKTPILVNDSPGFFTSRVFGSYVDEGQAMLLEGVDPVLIEHAARRAGFPVGPLAVTDEVGIALQLKVHEQAVADKLPERFQRRLAIDVIHRMLDRGRAGRRAGGGFYQYPEGGRKWLWPGLFELFPRAATQPDVEVLSQRLLGIQALESLRCLEEGVIEHPVDGDLGSVFGIGYPAWTGGCLSYVDTIGYATFVAQCDRLAKRFGSRFKVSKAMRTHALAGGAVYAAPATEKAA
jgi:3-hydroxyacyl-CoA dehydrogenase / enoyl-CoA hydratase / 3-hydroxybutyryl-CoA epimerase